MANNKAKFKQNLQEKSVININYFFILKSEYKFAYINIIVLYICIFLDNFSKVKYNE